MATLSKPYANADVRGVPAFEVMDTFVDGNLVCTAEPPMLKPNRILMADSLSLPQFAVVGLNGSKRLVLATQTIAPIGVLLHAAASGANNSTVSGEVTLGGDFNVGVDDAGSDSPLVWDASFTTALLKVNSVVGNPNLRFGRRLTPAS